ncbi:MAG TPA: hypothetical protein VE753_04365 [Gaiellaceae bacterium]|nr:hypothetical protein [Gaiellaceae bacterium]
MTGPARRRRRSGGRRRLVWALALALVFLAGIALGQALEDNPRPASTITREQTFRILPESSTVTVTAP